MSTTTPVTRTYNPIPFAVMPGSVVRGAILGYVYAFLALLLYTVAVEVLEGTSLQPGLESLHASIGNSGIVLLGFTTPVLLTLLLAYVGYRRREYEIGPEGVTERRGILLRSERLLPYEEFEGVTVTRSRMQSLYGTGTVLLTDVNQAEDEQVRMKMSYIQSPGEVSTNILRHIADTTGSMSDSLDTTDVEELRVDSASISHLSGDELAASTGFRYMMPTAILHPRPREGSKRGVLVGAGYSLVGVLLLFYFQNWFMSVTDLPGDVYFYGFLTLGFLTFTALMAGLYYWRYDRMQYELYEDHVKAIHGDETTSYSLADVDRLGIDSRGLPWNDVGHVSLVDDAGDTIVEFEYVGSADEVRDAIEEWLGTAEHVHEERSE